MNKLAERLIAKSPPVAISYEEIVTGELDIFRNMGLTNIVFCEYGIRSGNVAWLLTIAGIPTVVYSGGFYNLESHESDSSMQDVLFAINKIPHALIIQTDEEFNIHNGIIKKLKNRTRHMPTQATMYSAVINSSNSGIFSFQSQT